MYGHRSGTCSCAGQSKPMFRGEKLSGKKWPLLACLLSVVDSGSNFFYKNSLFTLLIFIVGKDDMP